MRFSTPVFALLLLLVSLAVAPQTLAEGPPGATVINGQKVLTLISRDPPGVRCNNNIQVAAELSNLYKMPVQVVPVSFAGPGARAPAVYYCTELIAVDGGAFNAMISFAMVEGILEVEGAMKQASKGRLIDVRPEFDRLKTAIKTP